MNKKIKKLKLWNVYVQYEHLDGNKTLGWPTQAEKQQNE